MAKIEPRRTLGRPTTAWGFSYRTCAVWGKEVIGHGYFFRQQGELLSLAARDSPPGPAPLDRVAAFIQSRRAGCIVKSLNHLRK